MRRFFIMTGLLLLCFVIGSAAWYLTRIYPKKGPHITRHTTDVNTSILKKLDSKAAALAAYAKQNNYNTQVCFMVDMSVESGKDRFFVYDLKKDSVLDAGLVTHGRCNEEWLNGRKYGNEIGCGCTSLGKYRVGNPYKGKFGLAYKLHGLDNTNNNAFKRFVVLHSHGCVPDKEVAPYPICQSDGCPTVSAPYLQKLAHILDASDKPILLWIYE
ncbi:MAG: murein L,D-transpeptidase catalytic domain family protein [Chitinophagaceae bacterium]